MKMKSLMAVVLLAAGAATAQTFNTNLTFAVNAAIPDADNNGLALAQTLALPTLLGGPISDVTVSLNISGGYNGDLYAYLAGPGGGFAVLLNRTGVGGGNSFGSSGSGFNITLDDSASHVNVHDATVAPGAVLGGTFNSDGENIDPQSPATAFPAGSTALLTSFNGNAADGTWTLFLADLSAGGQSQIVSWSLDITAVPEPASLTLAALGGVAILALRHSRQRKL